MKSSVKQRKASLLQALGIAGAGALSTKVAGKMGQSLATKGTEKLNNMRNTLRTSAVANVTKQAYQSVKNAPASWTQSLHKTYNNTLDSSMPRLMPDLVPAGPALAQQTVRETLQNVKQQTMQMAQALYNPTAKRYQDPETGRFVANPNVERVEKPVVKEVEKVQEVTKGTSEVSKKSATRTFNSTYEERLAQTPVNNGKWTGERGESTFIHENEKVNEILSQVDKKGIDYSDAVPDFSPVSKGRVEIEGMSIDRDINFKKADERLAEKCGVTPKEVRKWRKQNKYTWHEDNDLKTMDLVPSVINSKFGHLGGVSEAGKAEKKL
ncbi:MULTISPECIES: HNH endonuclease [Priestia]